MAAMADRASDDDRFDELYDQLNVLDKEREKLGAEITEVKLIMRNLGCI
jgi:hypothetical protein